MLQKFDERNRDLIVNVGGRLSHRDEAGVSPFDSVVQGGDAVWEGLRLTNGRIFALDEHLARLRRSAHALGFASVPSDEAITAEIIRTLAANGMHTGVHIRLTLTRGVKLTSGLAKIEANVAGADDAVMLDHRGFIAETNATHLFMVLPGDRSGGAGATLATPTTAACPEGITRATVLRLASSSGLGCAEGDYTLPQLYNASEVFVTGTMGGLAPVISVDGRSIGDGTTGPVTKQLTELYANLSASTGTAVA